jgi:hypothetical protein
MLDLRDLSSVNLSALLVYAAIALVTLAGVVKCIHPVLHNSALLRRAIMRLERSAAGSEQPVWREARFLGRALRPEWQRFLLNAGQLDLRGMPCNTQEYINEDTVVYKPGHAQLAELIPSLLTSLGILGTFIGLMAGLVNLNVQNPIEIVNSIPTLLSGMRLAFATSIAGISCSLAFNIINRMAAGRAFKALDAFDEAFYELAMPRPLDAEVQMICQKQDEDLNLQRTADQLGGQLAAAVEMGVSRAVQPMTLAMDNFIQGISRGQAEGMACIADQFVAQLNTSLNGQVAALADTLTQMNREQAAAQQTMQQTLRVTGALVEDARRIQQSSHALTASLEENAQVFTHARQEELLALLQDAATQQSAIARSLGGIQAELVETLRELAAWAGRGGANEAAAAQTAALTSALERMGKATDALSARLRQAEPSATPAPERT